MTSRTKEQAFEQGFTEQTQQRKTGKKRDAVSRFFAYLDRIQAKAEAVLRKAGYADPSALIRDPLTGSSRFHCSPELPGSIEVTDLPRSLDDQNGRRQPESYAFELLGWVHKMREVVLRASPEGREALVFAFWLGGNISTTEIGVRLPEVGAILKSWSSSEAAMKRKGTKYELRQAVEQICKDMPAPTLGALLEIFENEDEMYNLYEDPMDPIHIKVQEVNHGGKTVYYRTRRDKEKTATFNRLERLIRDIKKSKR